MHTIQISTGVTAPDNYKFLPGGIYKEYNGVLWVVHHFSAEERRLFKQAAVAAPVLDKEGVLFFQVSNR